MSDRFRMLAEECSATTAAIALEEVKVLVALADRTLAEWGPGDLVSKKQCQHDRAALARVVEILEAHCRGQELLDQVRDQARSVGR